MLRSKLTAASMLLALVWSAGDFASAQRRVATDKKKNEKKTYYTILDDACNQTGGDVTGVYLEWSSTVSNLRVGFPGTTFEQIRSPWSGSAGGDKTTHRGPALHKDKCLRIRVEWEGPATSIYCSGYWTKTVNGKEVKAGDLRVLPLGGAEKRKKK